jgi:hypothetical protein
MYRVRFPTETWPLHTSTSSRVSRLPWKVVFPEPINQFFKFYVLSSRVGEIRASTLRVFNACEATWRSRIFVQVSFLCLVGIDVGGRSLACSSHVFALFHIPRFAR